MPGRYLNGNQYRPSHIHFRVTAPDHVELVTQLYFQGDPYIPIDPWANDPDAVLRILPFVEENGVKILTFEIILSALASSTTSYSEAQIIRLYRNGTDGLLIRAEGTLLRAVEMFASNGDLVRTAYQLQSAETLLSVKGLAAGIYLIRAKTDKGIFVEKWVK